MSGGTAEDGKDARNADAKGVEATPAAPPSGAGPVESGSAKPSSEWTASDSRGPLRAPTETDRTADEVERFVPMSEVDAEGLRDEPVSSSAPTARSESTADASGAAAVPPASGAAAEVPAARRSPWPIAAGLIIGSLIGAGSAAVVYNLQSGGSTAASETSTKLSGLATRVDALEKRPDPQAAIGDVRNEVHALAGRVTALEKRPAPVAAPQPAPPAAPQPPTADGKPKVAANPPPPAAAPAPTPAANGDLVGKVAALQAALDAVNRQDGSRQAAVKDLGGKLDALQGSFAKVQEAARASADALKGRQQDVDGKLAALQSAVSGAQKQASAVQGDLAAVQGEQKALAGKVGAPALAVAADSLVAQVEAGHPYRPQVDALAALGADPARLAVLRENAGAGVLSAQALASTFAPLADPVIATGSKAPADAGFGEQLKHGLFGLVSVHRADDTAGNGLASRVALLQADLAHNDVAGAYAVWGALPADAKLKASAFGAQLKASAEALAAARGLQAQSIDSLAAGSSAAKKP